MILSILTFIQFAFCLLAIGAGTKVMSGLFAGVLIERRVVAFFRCSLAASVTDLLYSLQHLSHFPWIAMSSVYVTGAAVLAWRKFHLAGLWRSICACSTTIVLCLNILLLGAYIFNRVPALTALAPTESEPAFLLSQLVIIGLFVVLGTIAARRFRGVSLHSF